MCCQVDGESTVFFKRLYFLRPVKLEAVTMDKVTELWFLLLDSCWQHTIGNLTEPKLFRPNKLNPGTHISVSFK